MNREDEELKELYFNAPLYEDILMHLFRKGKMEVSVTFSKTIMRETCYQALEKIRNVISDTSYSDEEAFQKIEKIINILEDFDIFVGERHDTEIE